MQDYVIGHFHSPAIGMSGTSENLPKNPTPYKHIDACSGTIYLLAESPLMYQNTYIVKSPNVFYSVFFLLLSVLFFFLPRPKCSDSNIFELRAKELTNQLHSCQVI